MSLKDVTFGDYDKFNVIIEIPKGCHDKYEYRDDLDVFELDRVNYGSQFYPQNYGFIPETHADDGDHADVILFSTNPLLQGTICVSRAIGFMEMIDTDEIDNKILAVPVNDKRFDDVQTIEDLPQHLLKEIQNFFETYKLLKGNSEVKINGFFGIDRAMEELKTTREAYRKE